MNTREGAGTDPAETELSALPFATALRWAVHSLVYVLLALVSALALTPPTTGRGWAVVGVLALVATVYSIGARWAAGHGIGPYGSWRTLIYLCPTVLVWSCSFLLGPDAVWVAFGLDFAVLYALPPAAGLIALAVVTGIGVAGFTAWSADPTPGEVAGPVIGALVALAVVVTVRALQREVDRRTQLARRLAEARDTIAEQTRQATTAAERERIATELHDTVAQSVLSIHLLLDAADTALGRGGAAEARTLVQEARASAARTGMQTRRFVDAADADVPTGDDLRTELERITTDAAAAGAVPVTLRDEAPPRVLESLPHSTARALLRLVESLTANAVQHADASRIMVTVSIQDDRVVLDVVDDGRGFDPDHVAGFGLRSARARAASVGGAVLIESEPGAGTAVQVTLPVPDREAPETPDGTADPDDPTGLEDPR